MKLMETMGLKWSKGRLTVRCKIHPSKVYRYNMIQLGEGTQLRTKKMRDFLCGLFSTCLFGKKVDLMYTLSNIFDEPPIFASTENDAQ